jgi:hypothetical protein
MQFSRLPLIFIYLGASVAFGAANDGPTTYTLKVSAKATTRPALAVRFVPNMLEQTPGDAAPVYLVAATLWTRDSNNSEKPVTGELARRFGLNADEEWTTSSMLLSAPLDKLKSQELDKYLSEQHSVLELIAIAAQREKCQWDMPLREQGFATLLPHLQALRGVSAAVCIKARSQLAAGDPVAALRTLRLNFIMARNLNQQAVLIQSLVSASICARSLETLREIIQDPKSPNLFWTLADLPHPLIDMSAGMEWERASMFYSIPALRRVQEGRFTDADWRDTLDKLQAILGEAKAEPSLLDQFKAAGFAAMMYPQARAFYTARGMTAEQFDAMPRVQAVSHFFVDSLQDMYDEITKWSRLPYWQARAGLVELENEIKTKRANPVMTIVPAVSRAMFQLTRLDREIAALQVVEAVRDYAAGHDGVLPKSLADVIATPTPIDPIWGKPFEYHAEDKEFTVRSPAPPGGGPKDALLVKVTVTK